MSEKFLYSGFSQKNQRKDLLISAILALVIHIFLFIMWLPIAKYRAELSSGDFIIIKPLADPPKKEEKTPPAPAEKKNIEKPKKITPIPMPVLKEPEIIKKPDIVPPKITKEIDINIELGDIEAPPNYAPKDQNGNKENKKDGIYKSGDKGVTSPKVIYEVKPHYSDEAMRARIRGVVTIEAVIMLDGKISDIKVIKGLGYGLDEKAVKAVSRWKFIPGTKDGKNVAVIILVEIYFTLH